MLETATYYEGFRRNVRRYAERVAMTVPETGRTWTYAQLDAAVNQLARALRADGVGAGSRVVFSLPNSPEFAFCYLAPKAIGAISAPINYRLAEGEIASIIDRNEPAVFVYDAEFGAAAEAALRLATWRPARIVVVGDPGDPRDYETYVAGHDDAPLDEVARQTLDDETTRLFTSGTSGMPKGVPLTNLNEIASAHDVIMQLSLTPEDTTMNMTPWFHRGGVHSGGPTPVFYLGAATLPLRRFDPDAVLEHVQRYRIRYLVGSPTNLRMLDEAQRALPRDLSSLMGIVTMGSPLEREACIRYQRVLCPNIFNGYGTTEAFWNTLLRPVDLPEHAGSAGRSCIDDDVRVVRIYEDRFAAPDDVVAQNGVEIGEVIVRSPLKCSYRYVDDPEREAAVFREGWVYIGDLGTWDDQEYVTIVGRKDDMLLSGGENVHPVQVEEVLCQHPLVVDALVTGAPEPTWGEVVVAYVVARDPSLTAAELERHCVEHPMLARYKRPRGYRFVDALPLTATGKKRHFVMKNQAREDIARDAFVRV